MSAMAFSRPAVKPLVKKGRVSRSTTIAAGTTMAKNKNKKKVESRHTPQKRGFGLSFTFTEWRLDQEDPLHGIVLYSVLGIGLLAMIP